MKMLKHLTVPLGLEGLFKLKMKKKNEKSKVTKTKTVTIVFFVKTLFFEKMHRAKKQ